MFHADLALGKKYEKKTLKFFEYDNYEQAKGCESKYDLILYRRFYETIKIEVKCDRRACITGNLAIEYECNNKPSGLNVSESDFYVYHIIDTDIIYKIATDTLRWLVKGCKIVSGGDGYRSKMYLLPMTRMTEYIVKPINED